MRHFAVDNVSIGDIIKEDEDSIVFSAVIAREIVQQYNVDGEQVSFYKSADALKNAADTLKLLLSRPVGTEKHPDSGYLMKAEDVKGRIENIQFVKNLVDHTTNRPMDRGVKSDLRIFKNKVSKDVLNSMKNGEKPDVSIGFAFDADMTEGEWREQKYDGSQKNIFIDHVIAAIDNGRCPAPLCGLGVDNRNQAFDLGEDAITLLGFDPEVTEKYVHIPGVGGSCKVTATISISKSRGIQARYCGKNKKIRTYLFAKAKGWTMKKAKAWVKSHKKKGDSLSIEGINAKISDLRDDLHEIQDKIEKIYSKHKMPQKELNLLYEKKDEIQTEIHAYTQAKINKIASNDQNCPICDAIEELGPESFAKMMVAKLGKDVAMKVLQDHTVPTAKKYTSSKKVADAIKASKKLREQNVFK